MGSVKAVVGVLTCAAVLLGAMGMNKANAGGANAAVALTAGAGTPLRQTAPIAILGDSDSQAYQQGGQAQQVLLQQARFGIYQSVTFQWPEVLARVRPGALDLGVWGRRGTRRSVAEAMDWLGLQGRFPPKQDYLHNLSFGGASCDSLAGYNGRLVRRLLALMDSDPAPWRRGVVVLALGVNDFGHADDLDRLAQNPSDPLVVGKIKNCLTQIEWAVRQVHSRHPSTRWILVGIVGDVVDPSNFARWQSAAAITNIDAGFDLFDHGLQSLASTQPNMVFVSLRQWFAAVWGGRDGSGRPSHKTVHVQDQFTASNHAAGNDPKHALTADEHTGVVWNTLWARHLIEVMRKSLGVDIEPLDHAEVARFLAPAIALSR
jgi:hypothetical protein